jgi:hypothetical protein
VYADPFDLACSTQAAAARVTVNLLADNVGAVFVNGVPVGQQEYAEYGLLESNFGGPVSVLSSAIGAPAGFRDGINYLQTVVYDEPFGFPPPDEGPGTNETAVDFDAAVTAPAC